MFMQNTSVLLTHFVYSIFVANVPRFKVYTYVIHHVLALLEI